MDFKLPEMGILLQVFITAEGQNTPKMVLNRVSAYLWLNSQGWLSLLGGFGPTGAAIKQWPTDTFKNRASDLRPPQKKYVGEQSL